MRPLRLTLPLLYALLALSTRTLSAQPLVIRGRVVDSTARRPIAGVTVQVDSFATGALTDSLGAFEIRMHGARIPSRVLVRAIRFAKQWIPIRPQRGIADLGTIVLVPEEFGIIEDCFPGPCRKRAPLDTLKRPPARSDPFDR